MTYTPVTWNAGDLVTSAKLGQMCDNDEYNYKGVGKSLASFCGLGATGSTSWTAIGYVILSLPDDAQELTIGIRLRSASAVGYFRFYYDEDNISEELTVTNGNYEMKTLTFDVSAMPAGLLMFEAQGKVESGGSLTTSYTNIILSG